MSLYLEHWLYKKQFQIDTDYLLVFQMSKSAVGDTVFQRNNSWASSEQNEKDGLHGHYFLENLMPFKIATMSLCSYLKYSKGLGSFNYKHDSKNAH